MNDQKSLEERVEAIRKKIKLDDNLIEPSASTAWGDFDKSSPSPFSDWEKFPDFNEWGKH